METALIARLLATAGVTAVVGQRITWVRRDQAGAMPAVVLHRISGQPDYHHAGPSGLEEGRVQIDCWGTSFASAKAAANAIEAALSGVRFTQGSIRFDGAFVAGRRDDTSDEPGSPLFRSSLDLMVHHAPA